MRSKICHDCKAKPGELHDYGCDVERCPYCGGQIISCGCNHEEMPDSERMPWTGEWPGLKEAAELGFFCRWQGPVPGGRWFECGPDHPDAQPSLNKLAMCAKWSRELKKFIRIDG